MKVLKLKICGLKDSGNIEEVLKFEPDYIGFIFHPPSPRFVGESPEFIGQINVPEKVIKTGVFVNEPFDNIRMKVEKFRLGAVQLHGSESPALCRDLMKEGIYVIKVFSIGDDFDFKIMEPYTGWVDNFMFDTRGRYFGGNGIPFDWNLLGKYPYEIPFFLSGGIGIDNIDNIRYLNHPELIAVDINSRIEISPGIKDIPKLSFLKKKFDAINL